MRCLLFLIYALLPANAFILLQGQQGTTATRPPSTQCSAPEFRQFDFWVGSWTVTRPDGQVAGTNEITKVSGGCALREVWTGSGLSGTSLNYYDRKDGKWHQLWIGSDGLVLHLSGGLDGKVMDLSGEREGPQGRVIDRIRWTPLTGGRVQQEWEASTDGGRNWRRVFSGVYTRRQ